ncbi:MAG: lysoplasmalogenase [Candidatus Zipacnadales bacterium]
MNTGAPRGAYNVTGKLNPSGFHRESKIMNNDVGRIAIAIPLASWLCLTVSAACIAVMLTLRALGLNAYSRPLLIAASTAFVLLPVVGGAHRTVYGKLIIAGMVLCWIGDYMGPMLFLASVGVFLLAHVCFLAGFIRRGLQWPRLAVSTVVWGLLGVGIGVWLLPHVPRELRGPVIAYMLVISAMVACASALRPVPTRTLVMVGAMLFYVSDIFVARWRFVDPSGLNAYGCYPLYYTACLLLGLSGVMEARQSQIAAGQGATDGFE